MKIEVEISNPHYHPGPEFNIPLTKKRDLSVPPHWVANERLKNPDAYTILLDSQPQVASIEDKDAIAIVMPPRDKALWEYRQAPHIHIPEYLPVDINGKIVKVKVKIQKGYDFEPKIHFDNVEAAELGIEKGTYAEL